jgi:hypothetical protein
VARGSNSHQQGGAGRSRLAIVGIGILLGAVWGTIMWLLVARDDGVTGWLYLTLTIAMLGGGVAAFFGATGAARRGERIGPRLPFGRRRDR